MVEFSNRNVPATQRNYHADHTCMEINNALVPTLLGAPISNFEVDSLFSTADTSKMEDQFLKMMMSTEFTRHGPQLWALDDSEK